MHVGIMSGTFPRPSLGESLDAIVGHGLRHVQFNLSSAHLEGPLAEQPDSVLHGIRAEIEKRDMTIAALGGEINMVHPDPEKRRQGISRMENLISACAPLGTSAIATCTGSRHPESMWRNHPDNATEEAWQVLRQTLEHLLPIAEAHGVGARVRAGSEQRRQHGQAQSSTDRRDGIAIAEGGHGRCQYLRQG